MHDIFLVSLPVPMFAPIENTGNLPLGIATLALHAQDSPSRIALCDQTSASRYGDALLIKHIVNKNPTLLGLSVTVWNIERSLYLCQKIKEQIPAITIILGGPDVAADSPWLLDHAAPFDYAIAGEGESIFKCLAYGVMPEGLRGLLTPGGRVTAGPVTAPTLSSLKSIHDPFLSRLVVPEPNGVVHAEMYRGCRYACTFCHYNQGRLKKTPLVRDSVECVELFLWANQKGVKEIYLLDPSLEQRKDFKEFLQLLAKVNTQKLPLFCELRLESISDAIADMLSEAGVRMVETGLQSIDKKVLASVGRRFNAEQFLRGKSALSNKKIGIQTDVMIGLPSDTMEGFEKTLSFVKNAGLASSVAVFHTQVLPGTPLRSQAESLGITCENAPPYHVVETKTWDADSLAGALGFAEEYLGISTLPYAKPYFGSCDFMALSHQHESFPGTDAEIFSFFRLSDQTGCETFFAESFNQSANTFTLVLDIRGCKLSPLEIKRCINRHCETNPFAALCVIVIVTPHMPLDFVDAVNDSFVSHKKSSYPEKMFSTQSFPNPMRRVFALLDTSLHKVNQAWLDDLSESAGIILRHEIYTSRDALCVLKSIDTDVDCADYHYLDTSALSPDALQNVCLLDMTHWLAQHALLAEKIILSGLFAQWALERSISKNS